MSKTNNEEIIKWVNIPNKKNNRKSIRMKNKVKLWVTLHPGQDHCVTCRVHLGGGCPLTTYTLLSNGEIVKMDWGDETMNKKWRNKRKCLEWIKHV